VGVARLTQVGLPLSKGLTMSRHLGAFSILTLGAITLGGCYFQAGTAPPAQPVVVAAAPPDPPAQPVAVETAPEYYYGGAHFYPAALGGDWCPIAEPHVHDFPPDHPEYYAYDSGYYYYSGRPGEVYVVGRAPQGVRIHVVREGEAHGWRRLPPQAPRAPYAAGGRYPTREEHPAPAQPVAMHAGIPENHGTFEKRDPAHTESPSDREHAAATPAERAAPTASEHAATTPAEHPAPTPTEHAAPTANEHAAPAEKAAGALPRPAAGAKPAVATNPAAAKASRRTPPKKEEKQ